MAANPKWRLSGGASNSDPNASLGGVKSSTEVGVNGQGAGLALFDDVSGAETAAGDTEYRCVYVHNGGDQTLQNPVVWIVDESTAAADIEIAAAGEGLNATAETVANENTAPVGESFVEAPNKAGGLSLPSIPAGQHHAVWIRRIVAAATPAAAGRGFTLRVEGDTAA